MNGQKTNRTVSFCCTRKHCAPNPQTAATVIYFQEYLCVAVCYQNARQEKYSVSTFTAIQSACVIVYTVFSTSYNPWNISEWLNLNSTDSQISAIFLLVAGVLCRLSVSIFSVDMRSSSITIQRHSRLRICCAWRSSTEASPVGLAQDR